MKISIIVPIYNTQKYLRTCIDSLIHQTYENLEIILVNDGSTDGSLEVCEEYVQKDKRIKLISKKNEGVSLARNAGLDIATGEWIMFVDSDDSVELDICKKLLELVIKQDADMAVCKYSIFTENGDLKIPQNHSDLENIIILGKEQITGLEKELIARQSNDSELLQMFYGPMCKLIKKEKISNIRFCVGLDYGEDTCFILMLLQTLNKIACCSNILYRYIERNLSLSHGFDINFAERIEKFCLWIKRKYAGRKDFRYSVRRLEFQCLVYVAKNYFGIASNLKMSDAKKYLKKYLESVGTCYSLSELSEFCFSKQELTVLPAIKYKQYWMIRLFYKVRYRIKGV
jgi:glycosyltransferase involved in cell wall biosynthesis